MEIVQTLVIQSTGRSCRGSDYFSSKTPAKESGIPFAAHTLDSIECVFNGALTDLESIDIQRRGTRSDEAISHARARMIQEIYQQTVEDQRMEGLVFKDLSAPYVLGEGSRHFRYWLKFKPDYMNGSAASDLDVVLIGAYFGKSTTLCGVSASNPNLFEN